VTLFVLRCIVVCYVYCTYGSVTDLNGVTENDQIKYELQK